MSSKQVAVEPTSTGMSRRDAIRYYSALGTDELPVISSFEELEGMAILAREGHEAALKVCPCMCPAEVQVEFSPEFCLQLDAVTKEKNGNIRPNSSQSNVEDLRRMEDAEISKLDNPKGAMLIGLKGSWRVVSDGLHSMRAHMKLDAANGTFTNYRVRIRFMTGREQKYFALFGDGHMAPRREILKTALKSSSGKVLKGNEKKLQFYIAKNLNSFLEGKIGCDHKSRADEIAEVHANYRKEIEFVCSFPWLASMDEGYHTKHYVLSVFADALHRADDQATYDYLVTFVSRYSLKNSTSDNPYVDGLFEFLENPPLTYFNETKQRVESVKGSRQICSIVNNGVSFWLSLYLNKKNPPKASKRNKLRRFGDADTTTYHLGSPGDGDPVFMA